MFKKKFEGIIAVHNDVVYWISCDDTSHGKCLLKLPLERVLQDASVQKEIPKWSKADCKTLCIFPDHWFSSESYPFLSKRKNLIEPFIERKLRAAHPDLDLIRQIFDYRFVSKGSGNAKLMVHFLLEKQGYQLYNVLSRVGQTPLRITAPAFLWEKMLQEVSSDFDEKGVLLSHVQNQDCLLFFYSKGKYQFSRNILLPESGDRIDALSFEIGQSLHMYSQTTKSELDQIYLLPDEFVSFEALAENLSHDVIDIRPLISGRPDLYQIEALSLLSGPLLEEDMHDQASFFSIFNRQIKRAMDWRPVQLTGILLGILLLFPLAGENYLLRDTLQEGQNKHLRLRQRASQSGYLALSEYDQALNRVLEVVERPAYSDNTMRLLACMPHSVWLNQLDITLEDTPGMNVTAYAEADNAEELKDTLTDLIKRLNTKFNNPVPFTLDQIDIRPATTAEASDTARYRLALEVKFL